VIWSGKRSRIRPAGCLRRAGRQAANAPYKALHVAYCFLQQADPDAGDLISPAQVHLLLYYAQGCHLALHGTPLFLDDVVAGLLDEVYVTYGQFTTWKLRQLSRGEPLLRNTPTD